jgi:hypothetical protein
MTGEPTSEAEFPDDAPENLRELSDAEYEEHRLQRIHRNVSGEVHGGAVWLSKDEAVRVMRYADSWAVEAPPLEWKAPDYASDGADRQLHFIEYEMDAEYGLTEREAYKLAHSYMQDDAELTEEAWGESGNLESAGQQTFDDISTN